MSTKLAIAAMTISLEKAIERAQSFANALPADWPAAELSLDDDGEICFEWLLSHGRMSVSTGTANRFPFAWVAGSNRAHGVAAFDGNSIPKDIQKGMNAITGKQL